MWSHNTGTEHTHVGNKVVHWAHQNIPKSVDDQPNKTPDHANDSGKQTFSELPFNTKRCTNLKFSTQDAMFGLDHAKTRRARVDVLTNPVSDSFASGWLSHCLKQQFRSKNHNATEPDVIESHTNATATTDSNDDISPLCW